MSDESLKLFCGPDYRRMDKPVVVDSYCYATNGQAAVRIPADGEPNTDIDAGWPASLAGLFKDFPASDDPHWQVVPPCPRELLGSVAGCEFCEDGKQAEECPGCNGFGRVKCPSCGQEEDCENCETLGYVQTAKTCEICGGRTRTKYPFLNIDTVTLQDAVLWQMMPLPGLKVCAQPNMKKETPVGFRAGDIEGLAMPANIWDAPKTTGMKWWKK